MRTKRTLKLIRSEGEEKGKSTTIVKISIVVILVQREKKNDSAKSDNMTS